MGRPVALVTGASSGIGAATARRLANAGATVYGVARRADRLAALAADGVLPLCLDITDDHALTVGVGEVLENEGRIDVLVNNAGYGSYGAIEDVPLDEARRQLEVNVFALARVTQLVLPTMRAAHDGTIVNITSMGGRFATAMGGWYHASKFAVEGLSDALRQEVAPFGIRVVVVEPGAIATEWGGHAASSAAAVSGHGAYGERVRRISETVDGGGLSRPSDPDVVARVVERAVKARKPRTRYAVGYMARPVIVARQLLPDRVFDAMIARFMG
jgi:NAD(P)-dependent dehydrogenase (short-subunit alcohol dehydrogenase family)